MDRGNNVRTVLDINKNQKIDPRALLYCAYAYGTENEMVCFCETFKQLLKENFYSKDIRIYDDKALDTMESNPQKLKGTANFSFSISGKKNIDKKYVGFFVEKNRYNDIYNHLFGSLPWFEPSYFSCKKHTDKLKFNSFNLEKVMNKMLKCDFSNIDIMLYDIEISIFACIEPETKANAYISICINGFSLNYEFEKMISVFDKITACLDSLNNTGFHSSYISCGEASDEPLEHKQFYGDYIAGIDTSKYLLGCAWKFYINNKIQSDFIKNNQENFKNLINIEKLVNGMVYTAKTSIVKFSNEDRMLLYDIFGKIIVPSYCYTHWEALCNKPCIPVAPNDIYVYEGIGSNNVIFTYNSDIGNIEKECCLGKPIGHFKFEDGVLNKIYYNEPTKNRFIKLLKKSENS